MILSFGSAMAQDNGDIEMADKLMDCGHPVKIFTEITGDTMDMVFEIMKLNRLANLNTCLFIDDVSGNTNILDRNATIEQICVQRAHYFTNIILIVHTYKSTPKKMRKNTNIMSWYDFGESEYKEMWEEHNINLKPYIDGLKNNDFVFMCKAKRKKWIMKINLDGEQIN